MTIPTDHHAGATEDHAGLPRLLFLCTGNAARSVMAEAMWLARFPDWPVASAGTHCIEGQPMSVRTRKAMAELGLSMPSHRSSQMYPLDGEQADLVVAMAIDHVTWVRKEIPQAASRTATIKRLVRDLEPPSTNGSVPLGVRLDALALDTVPLDRGWEDVVDPAGGNEPEFIACAQEIDGLITALALCLGA